MKQDSPQFDFNKVGRQMPYSTPEGYFEQSAAKLRETAKEYQHELQPQNLASRAAALRNRTSLFSWWYAVAACATIVGGILALFRMADLKKNDNNIPAVYSQNDNNTEDWSGFADADLFLDNMNW